MSVTSIINILFTKQGIKMQNVSDAIWHLLTMSVQPKDTSPDRLV